MPPMPPAAAAASLASAGLSATNASAVIISAATDCASVAAVLTTFAGSMMPASYLRSETIDFGDVGARENAGPTDDARPRRVERRTRAPALFSWGERPRSADARGPRDLIQSRGAPLGKPVHVDVGPRLRVVALLVVRFLQELADDDGALVARVFHDGHERRLRAPTRLGRARTIPAHSCTGGMLVPSS